MRIANDIYQTSGTPFGTNSNTYIIDAGDELIMIDTGYSGYQWQIMQKTINDWQLTDKPITHTFITHSHFDHSGNAHRAKQMGAKLYAGESDAQGIASGDIRTIEYLFEEAYIPTGIDQILIDGAKIEIGNKIIETIAIPGHSPGSFMFRVNDQSQDYLFLGDFIEIAPNPPTDSVTVNLSWSGGPDYNGVQYADSLKKAVGLKPAILLPGHYYCYYPDSQNIFRTAYEKASLYRSL